MTNINAQNNDKKYDLAERTAIFSEAIIKFCKSAPNNNINQPIISQLIRAATSIGANYCEADGAESKKDFYHKISICKKEAKETKYWLRMIDFANSDQSETLKKLSLEVQELVLIFSAIANKCK